MEKRAVRKTTVYEAAPRWIMWKPLLIICITFMFKPQMLREFPIIWSIWSMARYAAVIVIMCAYLMRGKLSRGIVILAAGQFAVLLFTVLNQGAIVSYVSDLIYVLSMACLAEMGMEYDTDGYLDALYSVLFTLLVITTISLFIWPDGFSKVYWSYGSGTKREIPAWFYGDKNKMTSYMILCLVIGELRLVRKRALGWTVFLAWPMVLYTVFFVDSATAKLAVLSLGILTILDYCKMPMQHLGAVWYYALNLIFNYLLVGKGIQKYFGNFLTEFLERKDSLTGRVGIWRWARYWIQKSPLVGYGNEAGTTTAYKFHLVSAPQAHNTYLNTLYRGGVGVFLLFLGGILFCALVCDRYKKSRAARILSYGLCAYMVACQTDIIELMLFAVLLELMLHSEKLVSLPDGTAI